jgi:predicted metalloprotease with PDZ domain
MEVEVSVDDLAGGELAVTMQLFDVEADSLRLAGVPSWVDNPHAEAVGEVVRGLRVRSGGGDVAAVGSSSTRAWVVPAGGDLEISYRLRVDFEAGAVATAYRILVPSMDESRAWLLGNHVFLTPSLTGDRVADLIAPLPIILRFDLPEEMTLVGPPREATFGSLFELLSVQFGLGAFEVIEVPRSGGRLRLVLEDLSGFSGAERERLAAVLRDVADRAEGLFGGRPTPRQDILVVRDDGIGGLEGKWALHAYVTDDVDLADERDELADIFFSVLAHELVHAWLPIALFPEDDPWVKEGFTSWYGYAIAARGGWIGPSRVDRLFADYEEKVFGEVKLEEVALSDARLWYEEYSGESWRRVTYERGHAVTLLLDGFLREGTDNRRSLDDVLPVLFARHRGASFDRAEFLAAIAEATGVDAGEFFDAWVDSTAIPSPRVVAEALRAAIARGAFAKD